MPTMSWLIIFAARPAPTGPMCVQRPAMSFISGARRSRSAASPPAITVSVPASTAGGPPDTGASTQRQPVSLNTRAACARHASTGMVEKSTTSCGARSTRNQLRRDGILDGLVGRQVEQHHVGALRGFGGRAAASSARARCRSRAPSSRARSGASPSARPSGRRRRSRSGISSLLHPVDAHRVVVEKRAALALPESALVMLIEGRRKSRRTCARRLSTGKLLANMARSVPNSSIAVSTTSRLCSHVAQPGDFHGRVRACGQARHGAAPAAELVDVGQAGVVQHDGGFREIRREARRLLELAPRRLQLEVQPERREARIALPPFRVAHHAGLRLVADAAHERVPRLRLQDRGAVVTVRARPARSRPWGNPPGFRTSAMKSISPSGSRGSHSAST